MINLVITSAKTLSKKDIEHLEAYLKSKYGEYSAKYLVNDALIGGITIFDGTSVYDGSILGQLQELSEKIKGNIK